MHRFPRGEPWVVRGVWKRGTTDGKATAIVSCPKCGQSASLSDHTIKDTGEVTPSLVCPHEHCSFHEHVQLVGWEP